MQVYFAIYFLCPIFVAMEKIALIFERVMLALLVVLCSQSVTYSAAWTQGRGDKQLILTVSGYKSSDYYDDNYDSQSSGQDFSKLEINPFFEYGLTDDFTVGISPTLQSLVFKTGQGDTKVYDFRQCGVIGVSDDSEITTQILEIEAFARYKLLDKNNFVLSAQSLVKSPCILHSEGNFAIVDATTDVEIRALAGYGFKWAPDFLDDDTKPFAGQYHFANIEVAYRKRPSRFADQVKIDSTIGLRYKSDLLFLGQLFTVISTEKEVVEQTDFFSREEGYSSAKLQLSAIQQLTKKSSIQVGLFKDMWGRNAGNGAGVLVSLWYGF